ncbi:MAG: nicotinate-nucleotide--dimethylbenzimidazole phosphoribosyltransferase [Proteobacteria bacterium]|nr:nicotinate-nucleotide--dimethylbenzimidazole phosphoribosyltransferase [Pseudomonadota bacterium]
MSAVVRHVVDAISPASGAHAEAARQRVAGAGLAILERLAMALAAAQHTPRPTVARRTALIVAGDHGVGDPGISLGADHPTIAGLRQLDDGSAALCLIARATTLPLVLVDAGIREPSLAPAVVVRLGRAPSHDLVHEDAMTVVDATLGLEAGIALVVALDRPALLVLGALGVGSEVSAAALVGAVTGVALADSGDPLAALASARGAARATAGALELLAAFGGPETAVLAGVILAAASLNIPVVLDDYATGAAALVAARFAPHAAGYLIAAHGGSHVHSRILAALGLSPVFEVGLGHGEGTGAAMIVPMLDQVVALVAGDQKG